LLAPRSYWLLAGLYRCLTVHGSARLHSCSSRLYAAPGRARQDLWSIFPVGRFGLDLAKPLLALAGIDPAVRAGFRRASCGWLGFNI